MTSKDILLARENELVSSIQTIKGQLESIKNKLEKLKDTRKQLMNDRDGLEDQFDVYFAELKKVRRGLKKR